MSTHVFFILAEASPKRDNNSLEVPELKEEKRHSTTFEEVDNLIGSNINKIEV